MLLALDIPLDARPTAPPFGRVEHCRCVYPVRQPGMLLCWAACIAALNAREGVAGSLAAVAARRLGCKLAECQANPVQPCCDHPIGRTELEKLWHDNGYAEARYRPPIEEEFLREQLEGTGPVQIAFDDLHLMLLDRWRRGGNGLVTVRLMDPKSGTFHEVFEQALRTGSELGHWTGTVTGLGSRAPADCGHPACKH